MTNIKNQIESETGIKVSVRKIKKGSMKGFLYFTPRKVKGVYPQFDFDYCQAKNKESDTGTLTRSTYYTVSNIMVFVGREIFNY